MLIARHSQIVGLANVSAELEVVWFPWILVQLLTNWICFSFSISGQLQPFRR